jgi:hypothetical protein
MILDQQASRIFKLPTRHNNNRSNRSRHRRRKKRSSPQSVHRRQPFHTPMEHQQRQHGNMHPEDGENSA